MKIYSEKTYDFKNDNIKEHTKDDALTLLKLLNKEYCSDKTDDEIIQALLTCGIHTNFRKFYAIKEKI